MSALQDFGDVNPYYAPERVGLTVVASGNAALSYSFDLFVVWTDGKHLYYAHDSGCSCPSPFQDVVRRLSDLTLASKQEIYAAVDRWTDGQYGAADTRDSREWQQEGLRIKDAVRAWRADS